MIYMTHPLHGAKYCSLESEAQDDEKNGWIRAAEPGPAAQEPQPQAAAEDNGPSKTSAPEAAAPTHTARPPEAAAQKRGPGRPRKFW